MGRFVVLVLYVLFSFRVSAVEGGSTVAFSPNDDTETIRAVTVRLVQEMGPNFYMAFCTGTLISPNEVLAAGHCFKNPKNPDSFDAKDGHVFAEIYDPQTKKIVRIQLASDKSVNDRQDKKGNPRPEGQDVALGKLTVPFEHGRSVAFATGGCANSKLTLAGFGNTEVGQPLGPPTALLKTATYSEVTGPDQKLAMDDPHYHNIEWSRNWISGRPMDGQGCIGDSGGPIFCKSKTGQLALAGILSHSTATWVGKGQTMSRNSKQTYIPCGSANFANGTRIEKALDTISAWRREMSPQPKAIESDTAAGK